MSRSGSSAVLGTLILCALSGCAHMVETQAIEDFTFAFQEQDLELLKDTSSSEFEQKALRRAESLNDLRLLSLPSEPPSIVKVEEVSETVKDVTVQMGEDPKRGRQLLYRLVLDEQSGKWVVDDVHMKQHRKGLEVTKSVTEQMNLLLTVRDSMDTWEHGERDELLKTATPRLQAVLADLPPSYLQRLISELLGQQEGRQRSHRPEAQMDDDVAIVKLPRNDGTLIVSYRLEGDEWLIDDVAKNTGDVETSMTSLAKYAGVIQAAVNFLDAYEREDHSELQQTSTPKLYRGALLPGELRTIRLPSAMVAPSKLDVTIFNERATFVSSTEDHLVKLDLVRGDEEADSSQPVSYVVEEVTLYESGSNQRKRLSAVFTARERVRLFADAVAQADLQMIRSLATPEFSELVWRRIEPEMMSTVPGMELLAQAPEAGPMKFEGAFTEVRGSVQGREVIYRLRDWNGELGIDDIHVADPAFPVSMRERLQMLLPVFEFSAAVADQQIDVLQRNSSEDFNRLVWKQVESVPEIGFPISRHMQAPVTSATVRGPERAEVRLGDEQWGARVALHKHRGYWVVDEVLLVAGVDSQRRTEMKHTMRIQLANGFARNSPTRFPAAPTQSGAPARAAAVPGALHADVEEPLRAMPQSRVRRDSVPRDMTLQSPAVSSDIFIDTTPAVELGDELSEDADSVMPPIDIPLN